ncbi:MAG: hypothetical protein D6730_19500 [Bacteroidetes bacterium]|nr:MAG: hypothetical protein D6730_19500 [Bacteroidota bacterium]
MIVALRALAEVHGHQAHYKTSYDKLWTALLLADAGSLENLKADIYRAIGRYYSFYNRKENALKFLGLSLDIKKKLIQNGELNRARLAQDYYSMCSTFRELNEPDQGWKYLDSGYQYYDSAFSKVPMSYLKFEHAILLTHDQQFSEALSMFLEIEAWFLEHQPSYLVLFYYYLGNAYQQTARFTDSEVCYLKSLDISQKYHSHIDFTPLVHEQLSHLYMEMGNLPRAYAHLKKAKELDQIFFDSRSANNRPLLEIQDEFRMEKERQEKILQEQRMARLEQEDKIHLLQRTILAGFLLFLLIIGFIYFRYVKSKHQAEKRLIRQKREMEGQQAQELVELKNKELAASALKLIEKEAFIDTVKERLIQQRKQPNLQEINRIVYSISNRKAVDWKEFETRFVAVNKRFYVRLKQQFPQLTQGDLKLCALIKLNLSSKEMAKLLNVRVESVHTTRFRLRKKLGLSRDVNLKEFIARI